MNWQPMLSFLIDLLTYWTLLAFALGAVLCRRIHLSKVANNEQ